MTVSSWGQVPPGMPVHHHCVGSVEAGRDPTMWVDASTAEPALVAWQYPDAVAWVHDQLVEHQREAVADFRAHIDDVIADYVPARVGPETDHYRDVGAVPSLWQRLPDTLQRGDWAMEVFQLGLGRKLVLQLLGYADGDQPAGRQPVGWRDYEVCGRHARPRDKPYLGLTRRQAEHYARYGALYEP